MGKRCGQAGTCTPVHPGCAWAKLDKAMVMLYHAHSKRMLQTGRPCTPARHKRLAGVCGIMHLNTGELLAILETAYQNDKKLLYYAVQKKYKELLYS